MADKNMLGADGMNDSVGEIGSSEQPKTDSYQDVDHLDPNDLR